MIMKPKRLFFFFMVLVLLLSTTVWTRIPVQNIRFERISIEDGLADCPINCILQDKRGFIWLGTYFSLDRYDGYAFKHYTHQPGNQETLSGRFIKTAWESPAQPGIIWIGTADAGLNRFDTVSGKCKHFIHNPNNPCGISNNEINAITGDLPGFTWIGTRNGLNRLDHSPEKWSRYFHSAYDTTTINSNTIYSLLVDHSRILWIGTAHGLARYNREQNNFTRFPYKEGNDDQPHGNTIKTLYEDKTGVIWLGTDRSLNRLDTERKTFSSLYVDKKNLPSLKNNILSIHEDNTGMLWLGTVEGLVCYDRRTESFITGFLTRDGKRILDNIMVLSICQDREGILWIGTMNGVFKGNWNSARFKHITRGQEDGEGLSHNPVNAVIEDRQGKIWIGTLGGGIDVLNRGDIPHWTHYQNDNKNGKGNEITSVMDILQDRSHTIWVAANRGLFQFIPENHSFKLHQVSFKHPPGIYRQPLFTSLAEDSNEGLWIGTYYHGLVRYFPRAKEKKEAMCYYKIPADLFSLSSNKINDILVNQNGEVWAGTKDGLNKLHWINNTSSGNRELAGFIHYYHDPHDYDSLSHNWIFSLYEDHQGNLWVGTFVGLNRKQKDKKGFIRYGENFGTVFQVQEDKKGNIWFTTTQGLCRLNLTQGSLKHYGVKNGLPFLEFNGGACQSSEGELYFGGFEGVLAFFPGDIKDNPYVPPVYLTSFRSHKQPVQLTKDISYLEQVELSVDDTMISIEFSALSYALPWGNQYAYKLQGVSEEWNSLGTKREITFPQLFPGEYILQVKGSNHDGKWNETGTSLHIIVKPPFWGTWWFRLLSVFALVFLSYMLISFIRKHLSLITFWKQKNYIGRYRLIEEIGQGGMATVYKAVKPGKKSESVALKVLSEHTQWDKECRHRFIDEGLIIDHIRHENIVRVFERGEHEGRLYIAMELLEGHTLGQHLEEKNALTLDEILSIMIQLANVIGAIHEQGIIHRDLKPDNIFLAGNRTAATGAKRPLVKLLDFGLAKTQSLAKLTETGLVVGTLGYMSPEQLSHSSYSPASDIYSLGVIFYELVTLERPYTGETNLDLLRQIMFQSVIAEPISRRDDLPGKLNILILDMLHKFPGKRPDAAKVISVLNEIRLGY